MESKAKYRYRLHQVPSYHISCCVPIDIVEEKLVYLWNILWSINGCENCSESYCIGVVYRLLKLGIWNPPFHVFRNFEDDESVNEADAIEPTSEDYVEDERLLFVWSGKLHVILEYFCEYMFT